MTRASTRSGAPKLAGLARSSKARQPSTPPLGAAILNPRIPRRAAAPKPQNEDDRRAKLAMLANKNAQRPVAAPPPILDETSVTLADESTSTHEQTVAALRSRTRAMARARARLPSVDL